MVSIGNFTWEVWVRVRRDVLLGREQISHFTLNVYKTRIKLF